MPDRREGDDRRESVLANAKYLRNVRPIDPEEIRTYVEGEPHPAVVRQLLREEAPDLGLVERDDGTFVPVDETPVSPLDGPIRRFPERYARRLDDLLVERYGPDWHEGASGDLLRSVIRRIKSRYLEGRRVEYEDDAAVGYAIYHLPGYYAAVQYALDDLAERGLLGRRLRVLDVGAGVGGPALGLIDYLPEDALLEYNAVEPSAAADLLESFLEGAGRNVHATVHRTTAEAFDPAAGSTDGTYDLVLVCNVLSELEDPEAVLRRYLRSVAPDGSLLAMAPADKRTSIQLRELERTVEGWRPRGGRGDDSGEDASEDAGGSGSVTVYGPAVRLWAGETPSDRGWSFDVRPDLDVPVFQRRLDEAADDPEHEPGEFVNVDVQFSYSILRLDGTRRVELELDPRRYAKMAEMDRHVTNRVDLVAAKFSRSLSDGDGSAGSGAGSARDEGGSSGGGGRSTRGGGDSSGGSAGAPNPLFKVTDGSESIDHYAVLTAETSLNRPLLEADYGDVLAFDGALVLWNGDEGAYNLVLDEETLVDPVA